MQDLICHLDGLPCEKDCPDRHPESGCILAMAQELGFSIVDLGGKNAGAVYTPKEGRKPHE